MDSQDLINSLSSIQFNQSLSPQTYFFIIICAAIGGWFASYFKEKGKNYANKEDFDNLKDQLKQNTILIEGIKSKISEKEWISQQIWVKKQESYEAIFASLFHIKNYVWHQVVEYGEYQYINFYHPYINQYDHDEKGSLFELWQKEKDEYEIKSKSPETNKEAEKLKIKYEESISKLFEIIEVKSVYLDEQVGSIAKKLKLELSTTHDYEEWETHFERIETVTNDSIDKIRQVCKEELKIEI